LESLVTDTLRWGILGAGRFGLLHARALAALPGVRLTALCNRNPDKLLTAGQAFPQARTERDYRRLIESPEIDAVSVTTHWRDHCNVALGALESGKHVLLEKPMAANSEECRRLLAAANASKGLLMVGHVCRFDPRVTLAKRAIDEGRIGRIVSLRSKRNLPVAPGAIRLDKISPLMGDGIHDADLMMWFLGRAPSRVYAHQIRVDAFQYPDVGWAMLHFEQEAIGVVEVNWRLPAHVPTAIDAQLEVIGTDGKLLVDCAHTGLEILDAHGSHQPDTVYWPTQHGQLVGALVNEIAYFADCIRNQTRPSVVTPLEAARAVAVMEAAEQSAAAGRPLDWRDPFPSI
jgi:UDP-N-acetylglucosamine 3-dehydrogenase